MQIVAWGHGEAMSDGVVVQTWVVRSLKLGAHLFPLLRRNGLEECIQNLIQFVSCTVRCHQGFPVHCPPAMGNVLNGRWSGARQRAASATSMGQ